MPKLAANLSWIYQEVPFLQRFGAAAAHGFKAVEILFPMRHRPPTLQPNSRSTS